MFHVLGLGAILGKQIASKPGLDMFRLFQPKSYVRGLFRDSPPDPLRTLCSVDRQVGGDVDHPRGRAEPGQVRWFSQQVPRNRGAGADVTSREGREKGKAGLDVRPGDSGGGRPGSAGTEGGSGARAGREEDAEGRVTRPRYLPGAPDPMGRAREPHLNLPDDVTTPRRTPGQWEAGMGRGGARRDPGRGAQRQLAESCGHRRRGQCEPAAEDATATSRMVPSHH